MRYSVAIFVFVGLTSAAVVAPRTNYGYWDISLNVNSYANGFHSKDIKAMYHNSKMFEPVMASCSFKYNPQADSKKHKPYNNPLFSYSHSLGSEFEPVC